MTKKKNISSQNSPTLFDWIKETQHANQHPRGSLYITKEIKEAMADDLRHVTDDRGRDVSRATVAARMSDLLGEEITETTINNWTAQSHPHCMRIDYLPAWHAATGGQRHLVEALSRHMKLFLLPGLEALRAETQALKEQRRKIDRKIRAQELFTEQMEGK